MNPDAIYNLLAPLGAPGIAIAVIVWWSIRADKLNREDRRQRIEDRKLDDERRFNYDRDRLEVDRGIQAALAALTNELQHPRR